MDERDKQVAKLAKDIGFNADKAMDDPRVAEKATELANLPQGAVEEMARALPSLTEIYVCGASKEARQAMFNEVLGTFSDAGFVANAKQLIGIIDLKSERYKSTKEEVNHFVGKFPRFANALDVVKAYVVEDRKSLGLKL